MYSKWVILEQVHVLLLERKLVQMTKRTVGLSVTSGQVCVDAAAVFTAAFAAVVELQDNSHTKTPTTHTHAGKKRCKGAATDNN